MLSVRIPHDREVPAVMVLNKPFGGVAWLCSFLPQHAMVVLVRIAQLCDPPALIAVNCPSGGSVSSAQLVPQQVMVVLGG